MFYGFTHHTDRDTILGRMLLAAETRRRDLDAHHVRIFTRCYYGGSTSVLIDFGDFGEFPVVSVSDDRVLVTILHGRDRIDRGDLAVGERFRIAASIIDAVFDVLGDDGAPGSPDPDDSDAALARHDARMREWRRSRGIAVNG